MATENQMAFFRSLYDVEHERMSALRESAKVYIGLTSLYSAFIVYVAGDLKPVAAVSIVLFVVTVIVILLAILSAMMVTQVGDYEGVADPERVIAEFSSGPPTDEEFFDNRIADYIVAANRNKNVNDEKAKVLARAGYLFLIGMTAHATYFLSFLMSTRGL